MRRDKIEIVKDVLELCRNPQRMTKILRLANLQYNSFDRFVGTLVRDGYMVEAPLPDSKRCWMTTAEGRILHAEIIQLLAKVKI